MLPRQRRPVLIVEVRVVDGFDFGGNRHDAVASRNHFALQECVTLLGHVAVEQRLVRIPIVVQVVTKNLVARGVGCAKQRLQLRERLTAFVFIVVRGVGRVELQPHVLVERRLLNKAQGVLAELAIDFFR